MKYYIYPVNKTTFQEVSYFTGRNNSKIFYYIDTTLFGPLMRIVNYEEIIEVEKDFEYLLKGTNYKNQKIDLPSGLTLLK